MKVIIALVIISLTLFLFSCSDDTEDTASVQIPILLKNVTEEGTYKVNVTLTGTGIKPMRIEQDLIIQAESDKVYVTMDDIPRDGEWLVDVDMRLSSTGKIVVYQGQGQFVFSDLDVNNVAPITVEAVVHQFLATFEVTSEARLTEAGYLENGHIIVDAGRIKGHALRYLLRQMGLGRWTDRPNIAPDLTAEHTYIQGGGTI